METITIFSKKGMDLLQICLRSPQLPTGSFILLRLEKRENGTSCTRPLRKREELRSVLIPGYSEMGFQF